MKKIISFLFAVFVFVAPAIACETNEIDVLGDGTQCEIAHFTLTTTSTNSFQFTMSAAGTFYVDCGNGGTLKQGSTTLSNKTISRGSSTSNTTYTCTWNAADTQTIRFGGRATEYSTGLQTAVIGFYADSDTNAQKVYSITGDLGKIFGAVQSNRIPRFFQTFYNCSNLTSIPTGLFDSIDTSNATNTNQMFYQTFRDCSNLTAIPTGLFDSIDTSNATDTNGMFSQTFNGCSNLTAIPTGLFNSIDTSKSTNTSSMFSRTFSNCSNLTAIPTGLFNSIDTSKSTNTSFLFRETFINCGNLTAIPSGLFNSIDTSNATGTSSMFNGTFYGCSNLTAIPSGLFDSIDTSNATGTSSMFNGTFYGCSNLTAIPSGLFNSIDTPNATNTSFMFQKTFSACSNLTSMPASLFNSNINMAKATRRSDMFSQMFQNCANMTGYIPSTTFPDGITAALNASSDVFAGTQLATVCPGGTQLYATYTPNSKVACEILGTECSAGQYLPMNTSVCATCPTNGICPGGTYTFNDTTVQGITGCDVGYTLSVDVCDANVISVTWDHATQSDITENDAGSVTYGGDIRTPKRAQHINGKIFTGWVFNTPSGN